MSAPSIVYQYVFKTRVHNNKQQQFDTSKTHQQPPYVVNLNMMKMISGFLGMKGDSMLYA